MDDQRLKKTQTIVKTEMQGTDQVEKEAEYREERNTDRRGRVRREEGQGNESEREGSGRKS